MTIYQVKSNALVHGKSAWGARFLKPGFSFSEQLDLAFALGFPHLKLAAVDHPDNADPLEAYPARWKSAAPVVMPEKVIVCWLKDAPTGWSFRRKGDAPWVSRFEEPLTERELELNSSVTVQLAHQRMFMLEALDAPEHVLTRALARLRNQWSETPQQIDQAQTGIAMGMGAMLLRVPEGLRADYLAELADFAKSVPRDHGYNRFHKGVDEVLGKSERWTGRLLLGKLTPAEIVEAMRRAEVREGWNPDARAALFGGDEVIEVMRERWREMNVEAREKLVEQYAWIRSEAVVRLFLDMLSAPNLKPAILEWFVDRADFARPIAAGIEKSKDALAAAARNVLQRLDNGATPKKTTTKKPSAKKKAPAKKKNAAHKKKPRKRA